MTEFDLTYALILMVVVILIMYSIFRWKKWL